MDKLDRKLIYNLLSSYDILKYLHTNGKQELSSGCKFIYEKCTRVRLENLNFGTSQYRACINKSHMGGSWGDDNYKLKQEYFDSVVNEYKNHILYFVYYERDYFLLEYFSLNFTNLYSLSLNYILLPKNTLKNIIKNLPNLRSLFLNDVLAYYSKNDSITTDFKFSNHLKKLTLSNISQLEIENTEYLSIKQYNHSPRFQNSEILDISLNLVNTLKHLDWHSLATDNSQLFNEIITNNSDLTSIKATSKSLNLNSLNHISNSPNLTKFSIIFNGPLVDLTSEHLPKLPNIKNLLFYQTHGQNQTPINLLIENCENLEELKLGNVYDFKVHLKYYIKNLTCLKIYTIDINSFPHQILDTILPEPSLEQLKIISKYPIKLDFRCFDNIKKLKFICNNYLKVSEVPNYENLNSWKMISYPQSIKYYRIK
jgi:hypothetical protein